jgi:uncharacterized membrane protein YoaK (UPF0700 family)
VRRDELGVLALTAVAASTDAISYLGLGHVFPANMTGNTVLLGIGVVSGGGWAAARSALALLGFVLGAASGALFGIGRGKYRALLWAAALELAMIGSAFGWWVSSGSRLDNATTGGIIVLVSFAMGLQSATVGALGVGVSATYITGTWTQVSAWVATALTRGRRAPADKNDRGTHVRQLLVVLCYFGAAAVAAWLRSQVGTWAIALPTGLLVVAVIGVVLMDLEARAAAGDDGEDLARRG